MLPCAEGSPIRQKNAFAFGDVTYICPHSRARYRYSSFLFFPRLKCLSDNASSQEARRPVRGREGAIWGQLVTCGAPLPPRPWGDELIWGQWRWILLHWSSVEGGLAPGGTSSSQSWDTDANLLAYSPLPGLLSSTASEPCWPLLSPPTPPTPRQGRERQGGLSLTGKNKWRE